MAGKPQTQVYKIDLDASQLINSYRQAIDQMKKAGAKGSIVEGLSRDLDKIQHQFQTLSNEGAFGVNGSKGIENFDKKAQRLYGSLGSLSKQMQRIASDQKNFTGDNLVAIKKRIEDLKKSANGLFNDFGKQLKALNFDKTSLKEIKNAQDVMDIIQKEITLRKEQVRLAQQAAEAAKSDVINKQASKGAKLITSQDAGNKQGGVKNPDRNAAIGLINQEISKGILQGEQYEQIIRRIQTVYSSTGISESQLFQSPEIIRDRIKNLTEETERLKENVKEQKAYEDAVSNLSSLGNTNADGSFSLSNELQNISTAAGEAQQRYDNINEQINIEQQNLAQGMAENAAAAQGLNANVSNLEHTTQNASTAQQQYDADLAQTARTSEEAKQAFANLKNTLLSFFSVAGIIQSFRQLINKTFEDVKKLDKSFASIALVTNKTVEGMWSSYNNYADMAKGLGQQTDSVIKASALFYQQGLQEKEALELTANTMKLATLAGNDYETATKEMTSAIRGFKMEMEEGGHVTDVYSTLAASAAASVDDIAQAMARTASIANSAGMSFENTSAFLTQMIETTQESAENIGTSLKTIIARFTELKSNVAGTAESEFDDLDFNKVDTALKSVGVNLKTTTGQFRDLDDVFLELSKKWETLDRNTQRYVATIAAGSRQQSRFIAMMDNYERTAQLMDVAANSTGKADEQFAKYADTMEYKLNQLSTTWEQFRVNLLDQGAFKELIDVVTSLVDRLNNISFDSKGDIIKNISAIGIAFISLKKQLSTFGQIYKNLGTSFDKLVGQKIKAVAAKIKKTIDDKLKLNPKIDTSDLEKEINNFKSKYQNNRISVLIDNQAFRQSVANIREDATNLKAQLKDAFLQAGMSANEFESALATARSGGLSMDEALKQLRQDIINCGTAMDEMQGATMASNMAAQQMTAILKSSLSAGLNAAILSLSLYTTGAIDGAEALKMFGQQLLMSIAPLVLTRTVEMLVAKAKLKTMKANAAESASYNALTVAELEAAAAGGIYLAIIAGVAAILVGLTFLVANYVKNQIELNKELEAAADLSNAYQKAQERLNAAKAFQANDRAELKQLKDEKKEIGDIVSEYNNLKDKQVKTTEEIERMKELHDTILEKYPELVKIENSRTEILTLINGQENDLIDALDEQIAKKKELLALDQIRVDTAEETESKLGVMDSVNTILNLGLKGTSTDSYDIAQAVLEGMSVEYSSSDGEYQYFDSEANRIYGWSDTYGIGGFANKLEDLGIYFEDSAEELKQLPELFNSVVGTGGIDLSDATKEALSLTEEQIDALNQMREDLEKLRLEQHSSAVTYYKGVQEAIKDSRGENASGKRIGLESAFIAKNIGELIPDIDRVRIEAKEGLEDKTIDSNSDVRTVAIAMADAYAKMTDSNGQAYLTPAQQQEFSKQADVIADVASMVAGSWEDNEEKGIRDDYNKVRSKMSGNKDALALFDQLGITDQEAYNKFFSNAGATSDTDAAETLLDALNALWLQKIYESTTGQTLTKEQQETVADAMGLDQLVYDNDINEYMSKWHELKEQLDAFGDEGLKQLVLSSLDFNPEELEPKFQLIKDVYKDKLDGMRIDTQIAFADAFSKIKDIVPSEAMAKQLTNTLLDTLKKNNVDETLWQQALSIPWDTFTDDKSLKEFKDKWIQQMKNQGVENAAAIWDSMEESSKKWGALNIPFDMDSLREQVDSISESVDSLGSNIVKSAKDVTENGEIALDTFKALKKDLDELNLNIYDYVDIDKDGKITATQEDLTKLYQDQMAAEKQKLTLAKAELETRLSELNVEAHKLEADIQAIENGSGIVSVWHDVTASTAAATRQAINYAKILAEINPKEYDKTAIEKISKDPTFYVRQDVSSLTDEQQQQLLTSVRDLYSSVQTQIDLTENQIAGLEDELENKDKYDAARLRNYQKELLDATTATDKKKDAEDKHAKALEDVADKQEALNEKIKEYNELLYGSENRKSALDYLYNYDQAIETFSKTIDSAKEKLDDAREINDATEALKEYTQTTHELIVEEQAKRRVISAGLENYRNEIENRTREYTDELTGKKVNIRFGDYAKMDDRTGKYVVDQRLLNEAKFSDEYKDLIENNIETYNDYADKLKDIDEDILKREKELEKQRKEALKNYAAMESEIAEALKNSYEEEVDNLKNKYDSMKDADDDYLDALQDAIDKQRKLREQEKDFEDLAKKEKKLSLMQRDTSNANLVETQQLEEEIQDSRQDLLDKAVDNIIDELSKLYESQQELREEEVELKEALKENTEFWNKEAEGIASTFNSAQDYIDFMTGISKEFSEMSLAQQQAKLNEYGDTYAAASQYLAMVAMDNASDTGDFIVDTMSTTADEVENIISQTAETFTSEAERALAETDKKFAEEMKKAKDAIDDAKEALQDAIDKLQEAAKEASKLGDNLTDVVAQALQQMGITPTNRPNIDQSRYDEKSLYNRLVNEGINHNALDDISKKFDGDEEIVTMMGTLKIDKTGAVFPFKDDNEAQMMADLFAKHGNNRFVAKIDDEYRIFKNKEDISAATSLLMKGAAGPKPVKIFEGATSVVGPKKYAEGGLVDYTGPAWVDGSTSRPEAFLSAADTERIGNAAKILSNLPILNNYDATERAINNSIGDTNIEINLNIDRIESEVDVEEMVQRVKDEIVDATNPIGSATFLQQQL